MDKALRYGLISVATIGTINAVFIAIAGTLSSALHLSRPWHWTVLIIACFASSSLVTYLLISSSPLLRDYLNTLRRLLRLESLSHPLMTKFSHAAPGTYHHTLAVANIASRAAKAIGANSLVTRIGAYYHDVGKMETPNKYVENQSNKGNPHDNLNDPRESARIIINHVATGIRIAKEHHLPEEITDLIAQHHGTSLVSYFYSQAKKLDPATEEKDFRYPGPKPLTREAAILMLADIIEAATRSRPNATIDDLKKLISETIEQRITDHQLDLAGLTTSDLTKIRRSFLESLVAIFHHRIRYPNQKGRKTTNNGNANHSTSPQQD